jgi:DJ-1 family protein
MSTRVLIPLAEGFEDIEAIVPIDVWRRAGLEVTTAGLIAGSITASRKTRHLPDVLLDDVLDQPFDLIYLPGGRPGADNLASHKKLMEKVTNHFKVGGWLAAICAAPLGLDRAGLLDGKRFTCHPTIHSEIKNKPINERIVVDGKLITGIAAGAAMELGFKVVEIIKGGEAFTDLNKGLFF